MSTAPSTPRTGVWLIGARGSVATTSIVGALAVRAGLAPTTGLVTEGPDFADAGLPALADLEFGGHDVATTGLVKHAELLADQRVLPAGCVTALADELTEIDARIRPGIDPSDTATQAEQIDRVTGELRDFAAQFELARIVVIDVSNTEPPLDGGLPELADPDALERALAAGETPLPPSSAYALAAFRAGCSFVSFTPSPGPRLPALMAIAAQAGVPWAGSDGKTGETLLKAALGPMFSTRALEVQSWSSYNMLGGGDGRSLADPDTARSKTTSKARGLEQILGYPVQGAMHIDYVPHLGDWKTAMDHIGFEGFLGTQMQLQFTWSGCDSALAAPLVLDLARLAARAHEAGRSGPLAELGFFFKDPAGSQTHALGDQWRELLDLAAELGS